MLATVDYRRSAKWNWWRIHLSAKVQWWAVLKQPDKQTHLHTYKMNFLTSRSLAPLGKLLDGLALCSRSEPPRCPLGASQLNIAYIKRRPDFHLIDMCVVKCSIYFDAPSTCISSFTSQPNVLHISSRDSLTIRLMLAPPLPRTLAIM